MMQMGVVLFYILGELISGLFDEVSCLNSDLNEMKEKAKQMNGGITLQSKNKCKGSEAREG